MSDSPLLSAQQITKTFQSSSHEPIKVLDDVSFVLEPGETLGILGPNGAGKTTLLHILLGVLTPSRGRITYFGADFTKNRSDILQRVCFASSYLRLPSALTVQNNLDVFAQLYGLSGTHRYNKIEEALKFFGLWNVKDRKTGTLSAGQMTRVMLAKAFVPQPSIVLLDEPTASLDPAIAQNVRSYILEQQKRLNNALIITSHNMNEVAQLCSRVLVLKQGTIVANDTPRNLALTVSQTTLVVTTQDPQGLRAHLEAQGFPATQDQGVITLCIDEDKIAPTLAGITKAGLTYEHIRIESPRLEEYFLSLV